MGSSALDALMHGLKVIAAQREGDRLYMQDGRLHILHQGVIGSVWRWARGDTRQKAIASVTVCLDDALALAELRVSRSADGDLRERMMARHLLDEIDRATIGMKYMCATYEEDISCKMRITVLRERVSNRMAALRSRLGDSPVELRKPSDSDVTILYLIDRSEGLMVEEVPT